MHKYFFELTAKERRFLRALINGTMKQSGFVTELGNPEIEAMVQSIRSVGYDVKLAVITDESAVQHESPPQALYYLEEAHVWACVGENANVQFSRLSPQFSDQADKPAESPRAATVQGESVWVQAKNELLAATVYRNLIARLRNQ